MEPAHQPLVVGFDGSPVAEQALRYAIDLTHTEARPLRVVVASGDLHQLSRWAGEWSHGLAEEWAERARKVIGDEGGSPAEVVVRDGLPSEVLITESASASCLVLGAVGHGTVVGKIQGSVSQHVTRHAQCPVVVVRDARAKESRLVVVGVDGSPGGTKALEFALHHAEVRGDQLDVVYCPESWRAPVFAYPGAAVPELIAEFEAYDEQVLRDVGLLVAGHPGVEVNVRRVVGSPGPELVDSSGKAALVVVGSRGHEAFSGLLLGSVSSEVLRRAHCPVAVIR